jgi:hypothetical protein
MCPLWRNVGYCGCGLGPVVVGFRPIFSYKLGTFCLISGCSKAFASVLKKGEKHVQLFGTNT